jgi:hypothetical protein
MHRGLRSTAHASLTCVVACSRSCRAVRSLPLHAECCQTFSSCCGGWRVLDTQAKWRANGPLKLGPGLYVSRVDDGGGLYVVNGKPTVYSVYIAGVRACARYPHASCVCDPQTVVAPSRAPLRHLCSLITFGSCAAASWYPRQQAALALCLRAPRDAARSFCCCVRFCLFLLIGFYMAMREKFTTAGAQAARRCGPHAQEPVAQC